MSSNIKEHLELGPIPAREFEEACMRDLERIFTGSSTSPWWLLTYGRVLERNILHEQPQVPDIIIDTKTETETETNPDSRNDGKTSNLIGSFQFSVHLLNPTTLLIIFRPSTIRFRHLAFLFPYHCKGHSCRPNSGLLCTVLPHLTPAIVQTCRVADRAKDADKLEAGWREAGWDVPQGAGKFIVDVRLDLEDEDAPTVAVPYCTVLSSMGLDVVSTLHHKSSHLCRFVSQILAIFSPSATTTSTNMTPSYLWPTGAWPPPAHIRRGMLLRSPPQPSTTRPLNARLVKASSVGPSDIEPCTRQPFAIDTIQPLYCDGLGWVRLFDGDEFGVPVDTDDCIEVERMRPRKVWAPPPPELRAYLAKLEAEPSSGTQPEEKGLKRPQTQSLPLLFSSSRTTSLSSKRLKTANVYNTEVDISRPTGKGPMAGKSSTKLPLTTNAVCGEQPVHNKPAKPNAKKAGKAHAGKGNPTGVPIDIGKLVESHHELHSLTVPQLKAACRQLGLPVGGKKADLEQRIQNFKKKEP